MVNNSSEDFSLDKIVFSYKEFGYNRCNVCVTPRTPVNWSSHYVSFKIETAESSNDRWDSALIYQIASSGGGRRCFLLAKNDRGYLSEKEAIYQKLIRMEELIKSELKDSIITRISHNVEEGYEHSKAMVNNLHLALKQIAIFKRKFNSVELDLFG